MKYYLYISDAKVDMLLPQISDGHKKKVATELGFDIKVFSAKRKVEQDENDDRIARLETVVSFIREFGNLGTVAEPDEWIEDSLPMQFKLFREDSHGLACFTSTEQDTYTLLGGSPCHLLGSGHREDLYVGSRLSVILETLEQIESEKPREHWTDYVDILAHSGHKFPTENMRSMAKRLAVQDTPQKRVILETPLYVAKDD